MGIVLTSLLPWSASSGTGLRPGPPHFSTDQDVSSDEIVGDGYVILEAISIFSIRLSFSFASPYFLLMHSGVMTSLTMISNNFLSAIVSRYVLQLRGIWRQLTLVYPALCESFFLTLSLLLSRPSRFFFFSQIYSEGCFVNFFFVSVFFFFGSDRRLHEILWCFFPNRDVYFVNVFISEAYLKVCERGLSTCAQIC